MNTNLAKSTVFSIVFTSFAYCTIARTEDVHNPVLHSSPTVIIGTSSGMEIFSQKDRVLEELKNPNIGFYLHQSAMIELQRTQTAEKVAKTLQYSSSHIEVAEITFPTNKFGGYDPTAAQGYFGGPGSAWFSLYLNPGFSPTSCNINGLDISGKTQSLEDWRNYNKILHQNGLERCGAFGDPNTGSRNIPPFSDPYWNFYKGVAMILGGVSLDTPPKFRPCPGPILFTSYHRSYYLGKLEPLKGIGRSSPLQ